MNRPHTIGKRLLFGFGAVAAIACLLGSVVLTLLREIQNQSDLITGDCLPGIVLVGEIESLVFDNSTLLLKDILTKNEDLQADLAAKMAKNLNQMTTLVQEYGKTEAVEGKGTSFPAFRDAQAAYAGSLAEATKLCAAEESMKAIELKKSQIDPFLDAVSAEGNRDREKGRVASDAISSRVTTAHRAISIGFASLVVLAAAIAVVIGHLTKRALGGISERLVDATRTIAGASAQALAHDSSGQAARLEETNASLEEMSIMTKRNAENTGQAKDVAARARSAADAGAGKMAAMQGSMRDIAAASQDITNILKTIEEIAFQTNILSINAAVEAAHAGAAGAGFAVVAEEVRTLAQRCAAAAKETAGKIEDCVNKSRHGARMSNEVATDFGKIQALVFNLDQLVAEIAEASAEQNKGIQHLGAAVSDMDQITQANAGEAEQAAASAENLNSQADTLRAVVAELQGICGLGSPPLGRALAAKSPPRREDLLGPEARSRGRSREIAARGLT